MPRWSPNATATVSYRLAKQRVINAVERGTKTQHEVCDAQPELRRVAHHHSVSISEDCPICEGDDLVAVTFAFGQGLPKAAKQLDVNPTYLSRLIRNLDLKDRIGKKS